MIRSLRNMLRCLGSTVSTENRHVGSDATHGPPFETPGLPAAPKLFPATAVFDAVGGSSTPRTSEDESLSMNIASVLVLSQSYKSRMAEVVVGGPLSELKLSD